VTPQVFYQVDVQNDAWWVSLNERRFGPYSSLEAAMTAASGAAHKAEAQGYEAVVMVNTPADTPATAGGQDAVRTGENRASGPW